MQSYIFDTSKGETPATLAKKRAILDAMMANSQRGGAPETIGDGIALVGQALSARLGHNALAKQERAGQDTAANDWAPIAGADWGSSTSPPSPADPSIAKTGRVETPEGQTINERVSSAFSFDPAIDSAITSSASQYGVDPDAMKAIAYLESRGDPSAKNPRSSAAGLFQFIDSTAEQYGLSDKFDPVQAADAGARLARDNGAGLRSTLGRDPSAGELYLAHQQGLGGARKLLSNPQARAVDIVGADAVRLNGGNANMSAGEFANLWISKADRAVQTVGGGQQQTPIEVASADPSIGVRTLEQTPEMTEALPGVGMSRPTPMPENVDPSSLMTPAMAPPAPQGRQQMPQSPSRQRVAEAMMQQPQPQQQQINAPRQNVAQAMMQNDLSGVGMGGGAPGPGYFPAAPNKPGQSGPSQAQLMQAVGNPFMPEGQRRVVTALLEQQMQAQQQANDPLRQIQLEQARFDLDQMRNPVADPFTLSPGEVRFDGQGRQVAEGQVEPGFRPLSPQEAQQIGLPKGAYQVGPDNKISQIGGGVTVNNNMPSEPQIGTIPQGWEAIQDSQTGGWQMRPVPGGPAAAEVQAQEKASQERQQGEVERSGLIAQEIDRALSLMGTGILPDTGAGAWLSGVPGTDAKAVDSLLGTIKSNIGFDELNQMRQESPTGGALGQVTERELAFLQSVAGSLDQAQSKEMLVDNLNRLWNGYMDVIHGEGEGPERRQLSFQSEQAVPVDIPDGVDPSDWEFMTPEERALFQ